MATQQEEVRIKLGVDGSAVSTGLSSLTGIFNKFSSNITRSLGNLLKVNLASMFGGDVIQIWDKATQKLASMIYRVGTLTDAARKYWRGEFENYLKAVEAEKKLEKERAANRKERDELLFDAEQMDHKTAALAEQDEGKRASTQRNFLELELKQLRQSLDVRGDIVEQAKTQLEISRKQHEIAQLDLQESKRKAEVKKQEADQAERISKAQRDVGRAQSGLASGFAGLSEISLSEAQRLADSQFGSNRLPSLRLNRRQARDLQRIELLERWAQQQRIWGNTKRADQLSQERLDILKRNPFLSEGDRNPLKVAEEQLQAAKDSLAELQKGLAIRTVKK